MMQNSTNTKTTILLTAAVMLTILLSPIFAVGQLSCSTSSSTFTFTGAGFANEAKMDSNSMSTSSTHTLCGGDITIDIAVRNPDNVYYNNSSTNGSLGQPGYEVWLDNNDNLFDDDPLTPGECIFIDFTFSQPIQINNFKIADLDARGYGISASWQDEVMITGEDASGNDIPMTLTTSASSSRLSISGQTATAVWVDGEDRGLGVTDADGIAYWTSTAAVSKIIIKYAAGPDDSDAGQQVIRIDGFDFCCPAVILPIELADFSVTSTFDGAVAIDWTTLSENNTSSFEIEHSTDGANWLMVSSKTAAGDSKVATNYSFVHQTPATGYNYYRLVEVDLKGIRSIIETKSTLIEIANTVSVGPNPVASSAQLHLNGLTSEASYHLYDIKGQLMASGLTNGIISLADHQLEAGVYFYRLFSNELSITSGSLIVSAQ